LYRRELLRPLEGRIAQAGLRPGLGEGGEGAGRLRPETRNSAVEQIGLVADQHVVVFERRVVPAPDAHQRAKAALLDVDIGDELPDRRDPIALRVVQVAEVRLLARNAIAEPDQRAIASRVKPR